MSLSLLLLVLIYFEIEIYLFKSIFYNCAIFLRYLIRLKKTKILITNRLSKEFLLNFNFFFQKLNILAASSRPNIFVIISPLKNVLSFRYDLYKGLSMDICMHVEIIAIAALIKFVLKYKYTYVCIYLL